MHNHATYIWQLIVAITCFPLVTSQDEPQFQFATEVSMFCPSLQKKVWNHYAPRGGAKAGYYDPTDLSLQQCVEVCCTEQNCNVVFLFNSTCFKIKCKSNELCEPVFRSEEKFDFASMVIVRPVTEWEETSDINNGDDMLTSGSEQIISRSCDEQNQDCGPNEVCLPTKTSSIGICSCQAGYARNTENDCILSTNKESVKDVDSFIGNSSDFPKQINKLPSTIPSALQSHSEVFNGDVSSESPTSVPNKKLLVSVINKTIRLPENEVTLSAYSVPAESPGNPYNYKWKLLSKPEGSTDGTDNTVSETNGGKLKLSNLNVGVYKFKVTVTGQGVIGEATTNITVLPQQRENMPPVAVVLPPRQNVKLPNTLAVLDASSSHDDAAIVKYHWELIQGPLGYQPNLSDTQTLQLKDLHKEGNYSFRLTVTDTDGAMNSTVANVTVLEVPDYPPEANAGSSVLIYLPKNNLTLNGSLSSDDKGIASWEWTKSPSDQDKAVDMQNTHTPFLQLSHLEEGMYTFVLKVTDDAGQSSVSDVHVFVKPPTNKPPTANAGSNITIALPRTWVTLNGSQSTDDIGIVQWKWQLLSGPREVEFSSANESVTNVTKLTKGNYVFQLSVVDENENIATDIVGVTVTQNTNAPPKANAGGDQTLMLPMGVLVVNGSGSTDDLAIAKWQWTREPTSLAPGTIIDQTDTSPVLMVVNVIAGRYEFRLRVTDDQGEWDEDTVSIIIKADPQLMNLVELTLNIEASKFTQSQRDSALLKLGLLLTDSSRLIVRSLRPDPAGRALIVFYVSSPSGPIPGPQVVTMLKAKLAQDSFLLQLTVVNIQTTICQNNCSGHGVCDQETRQCYCEAFWMKDFIQIYLGDGEPNCGWSILYVGIAILCTLVLIMSGVWGLVCLCQRLCRTNSPKDKTRYALLDSTEQVRLPIGKANTTLSDSDTDSDVLFENRQNNKSNGTKSGRNGYKMDRRVKT